MKSFLNFNSQAVSRYIRFREGAGRPEMSNDISDNSNYWEKARNFVEEKAQFNGTKVSESEVIEEFVAYKFGQLESLLKDYDQEVVTEVLSSFVISGDLRGLMDFDFNANEYISRLEFDEYLDYIENSLLAMTKNRSYAKYLDDYEGEERAFAIEIIDRCPQLTQELGENDYPLEKLQWLLSRIYVADRLEQMVPRFKGAWFHSNAGYRETHAQAKVIAQKIRKDPLGYDPVKNYIYTAVVDQSKKDVWILKDQITEENFINTFLDDPRAATVFDASEKISEEELPSPDQLQQISYLSLFLDTFYTFHKDCDKPMISQILKRIKNGGNACTDNEWTNIIKSVDLMITPVKKKLMKGIKVPDTQLGFMRSIVSDPVILMQVLRKMNDSTNASAVILQAHFGDTIKEDENSNGAEVAKDDWKLGVLNRYENFSATREQQLTDQALINYGRILKVLRKKGGPDWINFSSEKGRENYISSVVDLKKLEESCGAYMNEPGHAEMPAVFEKWSDMKGLGGSYWNVSDNAAQIGRTVISTAVMLAVGIGLTAVSGGAGATMLLGVLHKIPRTKKVITAINTAKKLRDTSAVASVAANGLVFTGASSLSGVIDDSNLGGENQNAKRSKADYAKTAAGCFLIAATLKIPAFERLGKLFEAASKNGQRGLQAGAIAGQAAMLGGVNTGYNAIVNPNELSNILEKEKAGSAFILLVVLTMLMTKKNPRALAQLSDDIANAKNSTASVVAFLGIGQMRIATREVAGDLLAQKGGRSNTDANMSTIANPEMDDSGIIKPIFIDSDEVVEQLKLDGFLISDDSGQFEFNLNRMNEISNEYMTGGAEELNKLIERYSNMAKKYS